MNAPIIVSLGLGWLSVATIVSASFPPIASPSSTPFLTCDSPRCHTLLHPSIHSPNKVLSFVDAASVLRGGADAETSEPSKKSTPKDDKDESGTEVDSPKLSKKKTPPKVSKQAKEHVSRTIKSSSPNYRIQRELKEFIKDPPPGLSVQVGKNLRVWIVTVEGPGIYKGETFRLRIAFPPQYPVVPPSVYFLPPHLPV